MGGSECAFEVNGTCYTNPALASPLSLAECEKQKDALGIDACYTDYDYWAGAVAYCGGVDKMPTPEQLVQIAIDLYGDHGFSTGNEEVGIDGLHMDTSKTYVSILSSLYKNINGYPDNYFIIFSGYNIPETEHGGAWGNAYTFLYTSESAGSALLPRHYGDGYVATVCISK